MTCTTRPPLSRPASPTAATTPPARRSCARWSATPRAREATARHRLQPLGVARHRHRLLRRQGHARGRGAGGARPLHPGLRAAGRPFPPRREAGGGAGRLPRGPVPPAAAAGADHRAAGAVRRAAALAVARRRVGAQPDLEAAPPVRPGPAGPGRHLPPDAGRLPLHRLRGRYGEVVGPRGHRAAAGHRRQRRRHRAHPPRPRRRLVPRRRHRHGAVRADQHRHLPLRPHLPPAGMYRATGAFAFELYAGKADPTFFLSPAAGHQHVFRVDPSGGPTTAATRGRTSSRSCGTRWSLWASASTGGSSSPGRTRTGRTASRSATRTSPAGTRCAGASTHVGCS